MTPIVIAVAMAAVSLLGGASTSESRSENEKSPCVAGSREPCITGQDNGFDTIITGGKPGTLPVDGVRPVSGGPPESPIRTETRYVPTCIGNDIDVDVAVKDLCVLATETCPLPEQVRYWVYRREVDLSEPSISSPFQRDLDPPFICLAPDDPALDPVAAIPALIEREFKRAVVLKGVAEVSPAPDTLVNVETRFRTGAPASYDVPLTILGQSVVITATAAAWTWHFGDGDTQRLTTGSSTTHVYERAGAKGAYVVIEWSGTYRIGGDPTVRQVVGTATTTGDPVQVGVREARSELVDSPG